MSTINRLDDGELNSNRTVTDRMGGSVVLGNAVAAGAASFTPTANFVGDVPYVLRVAAQAVMTMYNGSFGLWPSPYIMSAAGSLTGNGASIVSARFSMAAAASVSYVYPTFTYTIAGNAQDLNLRSGAVAAGWNQSDRVEATINNGVLISSGSTGSAALTINGSFPNGVSLTNNGTIAGKGGDGGHGGTTLGNGGSGGLALSVSVAVTITNNGTIAGGGGGGGGGGQGSDAFGNTKGGGGGGGGRTSTSSGGGGGGSGNSSGASGNGGNTSTGGSGGNGSGNGFGSGGSGNSGTGAGGNGFDGSFSGSNGGGGGGGGGGGWGAAGGTGGGGGINQTGLNPGGSGGAAGGCLTGNGNITWLAFGSRYGSIS